MSRRRGDEPTDARRVVLLQVQDAAPKGVDEEQVDVILAVGSSDAFQRSQQLVDAVVGQKVKAGAGCHRTLLWRHAIVLDQRVIPIAGDVRCPFRCNEERTAKIHVAPLPRDVRLDAKRPVERQEGLADLRRPVEQCDAISWQDAVQGPRCLVGCPPTHLFDLKFQTH